MKKKNVFLLCLLAVGLLGACGGGSSSGEEVTTSGPGTSISSTSEPTTISFIPGEIKLVTYDLNYASKPLLYHQEEVEAGEKLVAPETPTRRGYDFLKWWSDPYCRLGTDWDFENDIVVQDVTLYASWERNDDEIGDDLLNVSYVGDGVSFVPVDDPTLPREVEETTTIRFKINVFENYEGTPIVKANSITLTADEEGIYSYTVVTDVVFSVTGLTLVTAANYRVYYSNMNNWSSVNAYIWNSATSDNLAEWPGELMFYDSEKTNYYIDIDPNAGYDMIIFNNGSGAQTDDLNLVYFETSGTIYLGSGASPTAHKYEGQTEEKPDYSYATLGLRGQGSGLSWSTTNVHFINKDGQTYLDITLEANTVFKLYDDVYGWNDNTVGLITGEASGNFTIDTADHNNIKVVTTGNYHLVWDGDTQKVIATLNS